MKNEKGEQPNEASMMLDDAITVVIWAVVFLVFLIVAVSQEELRERRANLWTQVQEK